MREALDELLAQLGLLTIAAAIALGYAVLDIAHGVSVLVTSIFTEQDEGFGGGGPLSLELGSRFLEFSQLVSGLVTLAIVLAAILYVVRPDRRPGREELDTTT